VTAPAARTAAALGDAVLAYDHGAIVALLAPDVVLRSPVVRFAFEGRDEVALIYRIVLDAFVGFELVDSAGDEHGVQILRFRSKVLGRETETFSLLRVREDGLIGEVVISVRPLVSVAAVGAVMGPPLARRRGRLAWLAVVLLSRPLPRVLELAEPLLPRLIRRR
jgi:hypothetical protein